MVKLNKFISLSLLSILLVTGCNKIDTFEKGKEFINDISKNYESKFNEVTSFGVTINKYSLMSESHYTDINYSAPYYSYSFDYNNKRKVNNIIINDDGLKYNYSLSLIDNYYYEFYNLENKYIKIDDYNLSNEYWNKVLNTASEINDDVFNIGNDILEGILKVLEGNIVSSYNLDYKIEFFDIGSFKMTIELSDSKENIYHDIYFNNYLLSEYSVTYDYGFKIDREVYNYTYDSNLNLPFIFNYEKEDSKNNLKGYFVNEYIDKIRSNILDNMNLRINNVKTYSYKYDYVIYEDGIKKNKFYESKLDKDGNLLIHNEDEYKYYIFKDDIIYEVDMDDNSYSVCDEVLYKAVINESKLNYRTYMNLMNEYLNKCKDLEVAYYSNKENDLDLKYNSKEFNIVMNISNGLLSYLYINNYNSNYDEYITLDMNDNSYFELVDLNNFNKK